MIKNKNKNK